ncbi:adenosine deaminase-like protein isoform X2 [Anthonomus grandis grandis]|uniref:adenosine deaminase-like protein isoform X2 n=1 Tax=Anthonomus grandis grandis TaxID=2921223 RepID=UPI00216535B0|nr:adenosine deaminase-like protein isoform X2 [Anthonomus grandis grandis]
MDSFCRKLPKIELHAHLNGSLSRSTLKALGCLDNTIGTYQTVETNLDDVFSLFQVAHKATRTIDNLLYATRKVIEEFADDNVIYLELRTTPRSEEGMSTEEYIETVVKAVRSVGSGKILVKLLLSLDRRRSMEKQEEVLDLIIGYKDKYPDLIKGVDLSGDPSKGAFFKQVFEKARKHGLYTAIHCAEVKNDEEVKDIIEFKPDRLGHGTFIHPQYGGSLNIWEVYKQKEIPVECCLTSNVICKTSKSYKQHHVQEWIKESLPFCLSTDDKGVFNTSLSKEFQVVQENFNLTQEELWKISKNSVEYSFASPEEKQFLIFELEQWRNKNIPNR